jgi:hypothetical protein
MAIEITTGFNINAPVPIDDRLVKGNTSSMDNIEYKYDGLRVFNKETGQYSHWYGGTWSGEYGIRSSEATQGYIPKFSSTDGLTVSNSNITDNGSDVKIFDNITMNNDGVIIEGECVFSGNGLDISDINASNISTGILSLGRLENSETEGQFLISGSPSPEYSDAILSGSDGLQMVNTTFYGIASIPINGTKDINISLLECDRIIYIYSDSGLFSISSGSLTSSVWISDQVLLNCYDEGVWKNLNYCYILPSGLESKISFVSSASWATSAPTVTVKSLKFGL